MVFLVPREFLLKMLFHKLARKFIRPLTFRFSLSAIAMKLARILNNALILLSNMILTREDGY